MKLPRAIIAVLNRNPHEVVILILLACSVILAIHLEQEKAEKVKAISELNEIRTMAEWKEIVHE
jgi:hypothetical protein